MTFGKLFVVGVPIGNWEDMPPRSINYIKLAKNVAVESPYAFGEICKKLNIDYLEKNIISIHFESDGTEPGKMNELENMTKIIEILKSGEDVYLISDEGMPGIGDPGAYIIKECINNKIQISSTAGPSVVIAAAVATGVMSNFILEPFLPFTREDRKIFLDNRQNHQYPMIIMLRNEKNETEFNDEIPEFLEDANLILGEKKQASLCYNLTYPEEFVIHGNLKELLEYFLSNKRNIKDKICMVIHSPIKFVRSPEKGPVYDKYVEFKKSQPVISNQDFQPFIVDNIFSKEDIEYIYSLINTTNEDKTSLQKWAGMKAWHMDLGPNIKQKIQKAVKENIGDHVVMSQDLSFARYSAEYGYATNLYPHVDTFFQNNKNQQRITFDIQLYADEEWGVVVEDVEYFLENNQALVFCGTQQPHWRRQKQLKDGNRQDMIFCHLEYVNDTPLDNNQEEIITSRSRFFSEAYKMIYDKDLFY